MTILRGISVEKHVVLTTNGKLVAPSDNDLAVTLSLLQTISEKVLEYKKAAIDHMKPELITFAITLCEKIIRQELSHPEHLLHLIDASLSQAASAFQEDEVKVFLSSDDLVMLEGLLDKISYNKREIKRLRFVPDPSIPKGDCRIETKRGLLNCALARQLEDVKAKVTYG